MFRLSVWKALDFIKGDAEWGGYFPYGLLEATADPVVQQFVVLLYEKATGKVLLNNRITALDLARDMQIKEEPPPLATKRKASKASREPQ